MLKDYNNFTVKEPYYNGYRLLSTLDKNKEKPEIFIATSNRSAGKTVFFNGSRVNNFIKHGKKFLLLYRHKYELTDCANGFFKEIGKLFFNGLNMIQKTGVKDVYEKLYIGELTDETGASYQECGYATSLSSAEQIKRYSHMLSDIDCILFDEFMPETGRYLSNEISLLMSIHDSLARGGGEQSRYLPIILVGNLIDIFNPYYDALGIVDELQIETKFFRGTGFVVEQGFNEASAEAHKNSAFHRALSGANYSRASQVKEYINTNYQFIDNSVADNGRYLLTIRYNNNLFSVRDNYMGNFLYVSESPDPNFTMIHAATENDICENAVYDPSNAYRKHLKQKFRNNQLKFKNLKSRSAAIHYMTGK